MENHVKNWLGAYMDGELSGSRLETIERHLAGCPECREELEELQMLSILLHSVPAVEVQQSPARFAVQVKYQLPRTPARSPWARFWGFSWRAAPFILVGMWAFSQVVLIFSGLVTLGTSAIGQDFPVYDFLPGLMPLPYSFLDELGTILLDAGIFEGFGNFVFGSGFIQMIAANMLITTAAAVLLWSWLASWLAYSRSKLNHSVHEELTRA